MSLLCKLIVAFAALILLGAAATLLIYQRVSFLEHSSERTTSLQDGLAASDAMMAALVDQESGVRGFLISGSSAFLRTYHSGTNRYAAALARALELLAEAPGLRQRVLELDKAARIWRAEAAAPMIELGRNPATRNEALALVSSGHGRSRMDFARARATEIQTNGQHLVSNSRAEREEALFFAEATVLVGGGLTLLVAAGAAIWLSRSVGRPIMQMAAQMERLANGDLDIKPLRTNRADEIGTMAAAVANFQAALRDRIALEAAEREHLRRLEAAQTELVEAHKLAALGRLVAGVAHELNTPIGSSLTVVTTLEERRLRFAENLAAGPVRRSALTEFMVSVAQANQLLSVSLEQAARLVASFKQVAVDRAGAQRRRFDLGEVTAQVLATLAPLHKRDDISVEMSITEGIELDSYPGSYGQIITNLVSNALLHAFDGRQCGRIEVRLVGCSAGVVTIEVADDGTGIPPLVIGRVFEPFFTTRLGQGGSGLGLHIAHSLVTRLMGGRIKVASPPSMGTTFILKLPLIAPENKEVA